MVAQNSSERVLLIAFLAGQSKGLLEQGRLMAGRRASNCWAAIERHHGAKPIEERAEMFIQRVGAMAEEYKAQREVAREAQERRDAVKKSARLTSRAKPVTLNYPRREVDAESLVVNE